MGITELYCSLELTPISCWSGLDNDGDRYRPGVTQDKELPFPSWRASAAALLRYDASQRSSPLLLLVSDKYYPISDLFEPNDDGLMSNRIDLNVWPLGVVSASRSY